MDSAEKEAEHLTRTLNREQCYLCVMTLVADPPKTGPSKDSLRAAHKKFLAGLENEGRIFGAGKLENGRENEQSDLGFGMFILRAESRKEAEQIAFREPYTMAGHRTMKLIPWQRTEGDITIRISFTNGTMSVDRRSFTFGH
ncbi:MAG: YciI family protein [Gemmatimonas sp.]